MRQCLRFMKFQNNKFGTELRNKVTHNPISLNVND